MSPKVLDCTFRDGGYYNQWDFDLDLAKKYLSAVQSSGIDAIEIGFRFMNSYNKTSSFSMQLYGYRLVCMNGMVLGKAVQAVDTED